MAKVLITDKINDLAVKIVARVAEVDNLPTMDEDKLCEISNIMKDKCSMKDKLEKIQIILNILKDQQKDKK